MMGPTCFCNKKLVLLLELQLVLVLVLEFQQLVGRLMFERALCCCSVGCSCALSSSPVWFIVQKVDFGSVF